MHYTRHACAPTTRCDVHQDGTDGVAGAMAKPNETFTLWVGQEEDESSAGIYIPDPAFGDYLPPLRIFPLLLGRHMRHKLRHRRAVSGSDTDEEDAPKGDDAELADEWIKILYTTWPKEHCELTTQNHDEKAEWYGWSRFENEKPPIDKFTAGCRRAEMLRRLAVHGHREFPIHTLLLLNRPTSHTFFTIEIPDDNDGEMKRIKRLPSPTMQGDKMGGW